MNQIFNFDRFLKVCNQERRLSLRNFLKMLGIVLGVILVVLVFKILTAAPENLKLYVGMGADPMYATIHGLFICGWVIFVCITGAQVFQPLSNKISAIQTLMLPGSQFEKYLARWIIMVPLALVLYLAGFYVVDLIRCIVMQYKVPGFPLSYAGDMYSGLADSSMWMAICVVLALQSFFVLGGALWPKRVAMATFGALILIGFIMSWIAGIIIKIRLESGYYFAFGDGMDEPPTALVIMGSGVVCLVNYALAYYRFKEAEIVNHW